MSSENKHSGVNEWESDGPDGWEASRIESLRSAEKDPERWVDGYTNHTASALRQRALASLNGHAPQ